MTKLDTSAFGKNDIRGIYGQNVTVEVFYYAGKGYAKYVAQKLNKEAKDVWLSVSRDARLHSLELVKALIKGITSVGANVIDIGLVPTPLGYFSEVIDYEINDKHIEIDGALIVTASHNPSEYNGLKMTLNRQSLNEKDIKDVKQFAQKAYGAKEKSYYQIGEVLTYNLINTYLEKQLKHFTKFGKGIKVVVDSANATGGIVAPDLYRELGCEVVELYSEPDGNFPNHHPNPSDEKTLDDIKAKIKETGADFGIAFDGDADRIGVVDDTGYSIPGDQLLLIFALDVLKELKGRGEKPKIISEVKCSQVLFDMINANGGEAIMWKTGHGYIKSKMKEERAILAGEMSGHIFFKDRYYGFDDAIYAGCRVIEIVAKNKLNNPEFKLSGLIKSLPQVHTTREVRYPCKNENKKPVLADLTGLIEETPNLFGSEIKSIIDIDGLRIIFEGGFAMIRQSNTEPVFTLRFESNDKEKALMYQSAMIEALDSIVKKYNHHEEIGV
ncbi:MAG: phosphomannomutase/phosphoglucomutase [Candidatus Gastranaerophilales bacterium]|nr:phosphomannomutase/phosphoglucomutase [Candidatus Gastranaerophilales bacterium]